jgi:glycosyltransferase involved in cell wall biosynthesis
MDTSVSIVIPHYNQGRFLQETLRSIEKSRTAALREVIIVDDGSSDSEALKVLDALDGSWYTLLRQPNRGLGAARNAGIRLAQGELILPVDSDNRVRKPYFTDGPAMFAGDERVGIVYGDAEYFGDRAGRWHVPEFNFVRLVAQNFIDACALFRKRLWEDVGGYDEHMPYMGWEDWDFWLRASLKGWRFVHLDEVAFDYRVRAGSMLTNVDRHKSVMDEYVFSKKELAALGPMRPELRRLLNIEESMEYRLGRRLLRPVRFALSGFHRRAKNIDSVVEPRISSTVQK